MLNNNKNNNYSNITNKNIENLDKTFSEIENLNLKYKNIIKEIKKNKKSVQNDLSFYDNLLLNLKKNTKDISLQDITDNNIDKILEYKNKFLNKNLLFLENLENKKTKILDNLKLNFEEIVELNNKSSWEILKIDLEIMETKFNNLHNYLNNKIEKSIENISLNKIKIENLINTLEEKLDKNKFSLKNYFLDKQLNLNLNLLDANKNFLEEYRYTNKNFLNFLNFDFNPLLNFFSNDKNIYLMGSAFLLGALIYNNINSKVFNYMYKNIPTFLTNLKNFIVNNSNNKENFNISKLLSSNYGSFALLFTGYSLKTMKTAFKFIRRY